MDLMVIIPRAAGIETRALEESTEQVLFGQLESPGSPQAVKGSGLAVPMQAGPGTILEQCRRRLGGCIRRHGTRC
jgi:hypothetical protein